MSQVGGRTKLINSLGTKQLKLSTRRWSGLAPWIETAANLWPQANNFFAFFLFLSWKVPRGTVSFVSSRTQCSPRRGSFRVSGKQNTLFLLRPVIKCLFFLLAFYLNWQIGGGGGSQLAGGEQTSSNGKLLKWFSFRVNFLRHLRYHLLVPSFLSQLLSRFIIRGTTPNAID